MISENQSGLALNPWAALAPALVIAVLTVSLNNKGSITHVINDTGAVTPTNTTPSNVVSFP